jgi:hypothetical protein
MSNARNNAKFNQEMNYGGGQNPRAAQLNTRNASSFNPIGFNPEPTAFVDDEKQRKKEKQRQYRDQLDQMVSGVPTKKATPEIPQQQYQPQYQSQSQQNLDFDPVREKRDLEQRYMQANIEKERSYPESKVLDNAPYGGNDYGRYPAPQNDYPNVSSGTYARRGESPVQTQNQSRRQTQRDVVGGGNEPASTFNQQDELRDQLLAKIRSGNKQPNNNVYNTYQMVNEERERSRREFERNVIDKAAQDKLQKEDQRASSQWEQKKKLERDTYLANQQAIQAKSQQKQRNQQQEMFADQGRIKDSLEQFQKQDYSDKLRKMRLMEENSKVLQQQRYDYQSRKNNGLDQDLRTSGAYGQGQPSPTKTPSEQYNYDRYPEPTQQKAPLVNRPADNWDQGDLASGMGNLDIKGGYGGPQGGQYSYQPQSYQDDYAQKYGGLDQAGAGPQGGYSRQQPQDDYAQYGRNDDYGYEPQVKEQPAPKSNAGPIGRDTDARSDYMKIRDKVRYGNSFNIISNELR